MRIRMKMIYIKKKPEEISSYEPYYTYSHSILIYSFMELYITLFLYHKRTALIILFT